MISKRLNLIASFLSKNDKVLDVGTDHALLPIYLIKNNLVSRADGSDISDKVLLHARSNVEKYNLSEKINLYLSDGTKNINIKEYNTLVICGMGFHTIKHILDETNLDNIEKLIIQTNNHYSDLRSLINKLNYQIASENYICDANKDYLIFNIVKGYQDLTDTDIICGLYNKNNVEYYNKQIVKLEKLLSKVNIKEKKELIINKINIYKEYLIKEKTEEKK
ncbi:MAG: SAM-dependent methyltransferase [Bacilli bacterium]|nr:SAM-dependent methyltransferase [Bacilli bacterium]